MRVQKGFSLVELMVALALGLLVTAGAIQLFVTIKSTFNRMESLAERQEALRFVADTVSRDVRSASGVSFFDEDSDGAREAMVVSYVPAYEGHPYCSAGERLFFVKFFHGVDAGGEGHLEYEYWCGSSSVSLSLVADDTDSDGILDDMTIEDSGGGAVASSNTDTELQPGIAAVEFSVSGVDYPHLASSALGTVFQVGSRVTLDQQSWPGASLERRSFVFNTFLRDELLERLELVPVFASDASS